MTLTQRTDYQTAFRAFVDLTKFTRPFSVTLTLKQSVVTEKHGFKVHHRIDRGRAVQNFRHFMNLFNRRVYGNGFRRYRKRVQVIPVLEGGGLTRLHYHCVIDCPNPDTDPIRFHEMIRECWSRTDYGYHEIDIQPHSDWGWINYISKLRGKSEFDQSVDWENLHQI